MISNQKIMRLGEKKRFIFLKIQNGFRRINMNPLFKTLQIPTEAMKTVCPIHQIPVM